MIESIMYFGGGFLVASLLAIILISFVHQRAVRLTQRRLTDAIPVSLAEIQADKDHLRAEFALLARRLEMTVEQLKAKVTGQLSDISRKNEAINLLKAELLEKTAVTDELAAKTKALGGKITQTEQETLEKVTALEATAGTIAAKDADIARAASIVAALNHTTDTQRVEIAVLKTQVEDLKSQLGHMQHASDGTVQRLLSAQTTSADVHKDLSQARQVIEMLHPQVARLEHELAARARELEARDAFIADQNSRLQQLESEAQELRQKVATARQDADVTAERLWSAKTAMETQLKSANDVLSERAGRIEDLERRAADCDRMVTLRGTETQALGQEIASLKEAAAAAHAQWAAEKLALQARLAAGDQALADRAGRITEFQRQVADFERLLGQRDADANSLRQEIAVLRDEAAAATALWQGNRTSLEGRLASADNAVAERTARLASFEQQVGDFERQLSQRDGEADAHRQEIAALREAAGDAARRWAADKSKLDAEVATLTARSAQQAFRIESLEHQLGGAASTAVGAPESAASEHALREINAALGRELKAATDDLARAQAELAALNREAETTWKAERSENALLRERISDIAAQIAQMTLSPAGSNGNGNGNGHDSHGDGEDTVDRPASLMERIRALQSRTASRISPTP